MAPPNLENERHTSLGGSTVAEDSMNSISDSIVNIGNVEIKECALENLGPFKDTLEAQGIDPNELLNQETSDLIKTWKKIERFKDNDDELRDASALADLIKEEIAGFSEQKLREMCTFSKISYGNVDRKLKKDKYRTKREFEEEGYKIIKFYDNELIEDKYCLDTNYKLEQHDIGYALTGSNSWNRDAGYVFIKDNEVTIAYHGTRDLNDIKEDLRASLTKLSFLPGDNYVHSGFYSLFKRSWPSIHKVLQGYANDQGLAIKDLKINVTGHSMGGALASIAALCLNKTESAEDVHVATFGSPRVFYNDAAGIYNGYLGKKTIRVACQSDPVPCLPHGNAGAHYKHVGKPLKLETGKTLDYLEPHYHKIDTYYNLIQQIQQENFKSDNGKSKYFYVAYGFSPLYRLVNYLLGWTDDKKMGNKEFFEEVKKENEGIKLSEIPIQYAPNLEEKFRKGEQEVAQLANDNTQLEERLNSIQQNLDERTKELDDEKGKLTQEQQKANQLNDQVDKLTAEFKGTKDQLVAKEAELDKKTREVTKLNDTIRELKETNTGLKGDIDNLNNHLAEKNKELVDVRTQLKESKEAQKNLTEELEKIQAQFEQENHHLASQIEEFKRKYEQIKVQLVESNRNLDEEISKVTRLRNESNAIGDRVTQLTTQNTKLARQLSSARQDSDNKAVEINQLKKVVDTLNNNEELNDKNKNFLEVSTYGKKRCIYVAVSFVSSGAFAVGASLTMLHLAICISLAVAALTSFAVGCYCSHKANTALSNVEVGQIGNCIVA